MTSVQQDRSFKDSVIEDSLLEKAIDWISRNMSPEEVFSVDQLSDWSKNNGYMEETE